MRIPQITVLKTCCLALVIFCHALLPFDGTNFFWKLNADEPLPFASLLGQFLGPVVVPSFIFASGFLWALGLEQNQRSPLRQLLRRAKRLLLPWLLMVVFWMAPLYTLLDPPVFNRPSGTPFWETLRLGLTGVFVDHLWFLLALFWASLFWIALSPWLGKRRVWQGAAVALLAALCIERWGKALTWHCLWQTAAPILCFYLGCVVCWHRERIDEQLARHSLVYLGAFLCLLLLLLPYAGAAPGFWLACCAACLFSYQCSSMLARSLYPKMQNLSWYRYFEKNSFRYYLFHMPTALAAFMLLDKFRLLPPVPFIAASFALTLAATTALVAASHWAEERFKAFVDERENVRTPV